MESTNLLGLDIYDSSDDSEPQVPQATGPIQVDDVLDEQDAIIASIEAETEAAFAAASDLNLANSDAELQIPTAASVRTTPSANDICDADAGSSSHNRVAAVEITVNTEPHFQIPPPPTNQAFNTPEDAIKSINDFTGPHGYALVKKRTKNDKLGNVKTVYLQCNRGGIYRSRLEEGNRKRNRATRCSECPFDAVLRFSKEVYAWSLDVRNPAHNHGPAPASTHPSLRRQELATKATQIAAQITLGAPTRQILSGIDREAQSSLKAQDIRNLRKKLRRQFLKGRTPIQALISQLPEDSDWSFNYEFSEDYHVATLFGIHKSSLEILR